jgi:hypothetical protein
MKKLNVRTETKIEEIVENGILERRKTESETHTLYKGKFHEYLDFDPTLHLETIYRVDGIDYRGKVFFFQDKYWFIANGGLMYNDYRYVVEVSPQDKIRWIAIETSYRSE